MTELNQGGALDALLKPRSIAVIGASRQQNTIGNQIVSNLVAHGFTGPVYPVNPRATSVSSIPAWPDLHSLPATVDCAIVCVPKEYVLGVAEECGLNGVKGLVVISAGFREIGGEGVERERQLIEIVHQHGMRMLGPNCMGAINTDPLFRMNGTFAPLMPPGGKAAFVSQSGALGVSVLDYATELGIGIGQFVSVGNKADVSGKRSPSPVGARSGSRADSDVRRELRKSAPVPGDRRTHHAAQAHCCSQGRTFSRWSAAASSHTGALAAKIHRLKHF
jgi:Acyl-CoA synthetase (NDP forming)